MKLALLLAAVVLSANQNAGLKQTTHQRITEIVKAVKPSSDKSYQERIAKTVISSSKQYKVPIGVILATAYVESEFNMNSKPCIGVMQVEYRTYKAMDAHTGLNPRKLEDNIKLGTRELSRYYHAKLASRGSNNWRLRYTWGRYNGAGPNSGYVSKVLKVYSNINKPISQIKEIVSKKPLWR